MRSVRRRCVEAPLPAMLAALLWLLLLRGAAAEDISCVETGGLSCFSRSPYCECKNRVHTCADDGHDCTLTCSGNWACRGMTIKGPPDPHKLHVICTGGGYDTCRSIQVHGEASAGVRFTCGTTHSYCGSGADIFCPGCAQNGVTDACAAYPAGSSGSGVCSVRCTASQSGQYATCAQLHVFSGPRGTAVACLEEPGTAAVSTSRDCLLYTSDAADE